MSMHNSKVWVFFWAGILWACAVQGQYEDSLHLTPAFSLGEDVVSFTTDVPGNIYTISANFDFKRYSPDGEFQAMNNIADPGQIPLMDVSNPMNILLYYPDYLLIRIVDRQLSHMAEISLTRWGFYDVPVAAATNDQHIWLFDQSRSAIHKVNMQGQTVQSSPELRQWAGKSVKPLKLVQRGNQLYLLNSDHSLIIADLFAQPQMHITDTAIDQFQVFEGTLYYSTLPVPGETHHKMLYKMNLETGQIAEIEINYNIPRSAKWRLSHEHILWLTAGNITAYER